MQKSQDNVYLILSRGVTAVWAAYDEPIERFKQNEQTKVNTRIEDDVQVNYITTSENVLHELGYAEYPFHKCAKPTKYHIQ